MITRRRFIQGTSAAVMAPFYSLAQAQAQPSKWPTKPLTYVVPLAAGGATDIMGRLVSERLAQRLGVPVIVENRTGAGGSIGAEVVARAPADGYTLLGGSISTNAIIGALYKNLSFDPATAFTPLAMIGVNPLLLCVAENSPYKNLKELLAAARTKADNLSFASAGNGTSMHLAMELLCYKAGVKMVHVPYRGSAQALAALLGNQVDMAFDTAIVCEPHIKAGKLRPLATGSKERLARFPDVPTMEEEGVDAVEVFSWLAIFLRSGTDPAIEQRLRTELNGILSAPDVRDRITELGTLPAQWDQAQLQQFLDGEIVKWRTVVDAMGISL